MRRRDLAKFALGAASGSSAALAQPPAPNTGIGGCTPPCYPPTEAESAAPDKPADLSFPPGNVLRWGADPTGMVDSTVAIQHAMNIAWASGYDASPWSGSGGATPVILFPPGRYRVSGSITVPTGVTVRGAGHPAHTTNHTRIIMDSSRTSDNRNKAIFRFNRGTPNHGALMNTALTSTIEDLEFWFVTPGGTFDAPLSAGIAFGAYPDGAALLFDVDAADTRIINCVFQHSPAAIRVKNVGLPERLRGDAWVGNRGVGVFVENCEFDAGCTHVFATGSWLDLQFKECQFFGAMHRYEGCSGSIVYQSGRWHGRAFVDAATVANDFGRFTLKGADIEIGAGNPFVALRRARLIDISQNSVLGGAGEKSWIEIEDADAGSVVSNAIDNSGRNAAAGSKPADFCAAIKLSGCRHVLVASNNITATAAGNYPGFGILSCDSARPAQGNVVNGNAVSAPYGGPAWKGQGRRINLVPADQQGQNFIVDTVG